MAINLALTLTLDGRDAFWNSGNTGTKLDITHLQFGTRNRLPTGEESLLSLPKQSVKIQNGNKIGPDQVRIMATMPGIENYNVTEIGLWSGEPGLVGSILVAYTSVRTGYIAQMVNGIDLVFTYDMVIATTDIDKINIVKDTDQSSTFSLLAAHETDRNAHPFYVTTDTAQTISGAKTFTNKAIFSGGLTGELTGNAATATQLETPRTIGGVSFNGTANINLPGVNIAGNQNTSGNAATASKLAAAVLVGGIAFDGSAAINLPGVNIAGNQNTSGNAATATKLQTARTIALSGAVTGTATNFDGSENITIATTSIDGSKINTGTIPAERIPTLNQNTTGSAKVVLNQGNVAPLTGTASPERGLSMVQGYNNGYPHAYGNSLRLGGHGQGEIYVGWSDLNGGLAPSFIRNKRDNADANWSAWREIVFKDEIGTLSAATATKLATARTIGGVSFDGTADINLPGVNTTGNQSTTGNAATATKLATARSINGVGFDGTANITIADNTKLPLTGGTLTGGLTAPNLTATGSINATTCGVTGMGNYSPTGQGAYLSWNRNDGGGRTDFINNRGGGAGGFDWWNGNESSYTQVMSLDQSGVLSTKGGFNGNAASATKLQTARTINGVSFDGTSNITIAAETPSITLINSDATLASATTPGLYSVAGYSIAGLYDYGLLRVWSFGGVWNQMFISHNSNSNGSVAIRQSWNGTAGYNAWRVIDSPNVGGNAATATKLQTARTINGVSFDGTANITVADSTKLPLTGGTINGSITTTNLSVRSGLINSDDNNHYIDIGKDGVDRMNFGSYGGIFNFYNTNKGTGTESTIGVSIANNKVKATTFEGALTGNAATATKLATARTINGMAFDGTANITITDNTKLPLAGGTITGSLNVSDTITVTGVGDHANAFKKLIQADTTTDGGYIAVGNNGSDKGYVEIGTIDDPDAAICARKRNAANTVIDEAYILGSDGNTSFPKSVFIHNVPSGYGTCGLVAGTADNARYDGCNIDITSWFGVGIKASNSGERTVVFNARTGDISNKGSINTVGLVNGKGLGVTSADGLGSGLSLYNGAVDGLPTYGIAFAQIQHHGGYGYVDGDWATYFTMEGAYNRGWIFKSHTRGNVASISSTGDAYFNGVISAEKYHTRNKSIAATGYTPLTNGVILQWGTNLVEGDSDLTVTFPVAFPNGFLSAQASLGMNNWSVRGDAGCGAHSPTNTTLVIRNGAGPAGDLFWLAIGY